MAITVWSHDQIVSASCLVAHIAGVRTVVKILDKEFSAVKFSIVQVSTVACLLLSRYNCKRSCDEPVCTMGGAEVTF